MSPPCPWVWATTVRMTGWAMACTCTGRGPAGPCALPPCTCSAVHPAVQNEPTPAGVTHCPGSGIRVGKTSCLPSRSVPPSLWGPCLLRAYVTEFGHACDGITYLGSRPACTALCMHGSSRGGAATFDMVGHGTCNKRPSSCGHLQNPHTVCDSAPTPTL